MTKTGGRPRRYPWELPEPFANREIEQQVALMGELIERAVDQVNDLPSEALRFRPEGVHFSIARLALHMTGSEYGQMQNLLPLMIRAPQGGAAAEEGEPVLGAHIAERLEHRVIDSSAAIPDELYDGEVLAHTMREVHRRFTVPVCRRIVDPDARLADKCLFETPRDLIAHMNWHWSYHSGQIGLLRLQWGDDYVWTMADRPRR